MTVRMDAVRVEIDVRNGRVSGVTGIPGLLTSLGVQGLPGMNLEALLGLALQQGAPFDKAMSAAAQGVGIFLATTVGKVGGMIEFNNGFVADGAPMVLSTPIATLIATGLQEVRHPEIVRRQLAPMSSRRVQLHLPPRISPERWGLSPVVLRLVRKAEEAPTVSRLLRTAEGVGRAEEWASLDLLMQLGMLRIQDKSASPKPTPPPKPPKVEDHSEELRAKHKVLSAQKPWELLELKAPTDVNDVNIEKACRTISAQFHPDRFSGANEQTQGLAQLCFALVMEAGEAMKDEGLRQEVKARLDAEMRGEQYVTDQERKDAELAYARGQVAFRRRQFEQAEREFTEANDLNPEPWRHGYMLLRTLHQTGKKPPEETANALLELVGPRGTMRADVMAEAGEILLGAGLEEQAYATFGKVLEIHPEHVGAQRHMRLRKKRAQAEQKEASSSGLLGGLFSRRKR